MAVAGKDAGEAKRRGSSFGNYWAPLKTSVFRGALFFKKAK
jgi:hypothetical protein